METNVQPATPPAGELPTQPAMARWRSEEVSGSPPPRCEKILKAGIAGLFAVIAVVELGFASNQEPEIDSRHILGKTVHELAYCQKQASDAGLCVFGH